MTKSVVVIGLFAAMGSSGVWAGDWRECVDPAAAFHRVNPNILRAIIMEESRGKAQTITRNTDGSVDVGLTGINSIHFGMLATKGVPSHQLRDGCTAVYVGAWLYSKKVAKYGNTWRAVGAYHSESGYHGVRYRIRIFNHLVDMGMLAGPRLQELPFRPSSQVVSSN